MAGKPYPRQPSSSAPASSSRPVTARAIALMVLLDVERDDTFADDSLDRRLTAHPLDVRDRALALELIYGVLRHRATLDWRLGRISQHALERLPLSVLNALRLGAYQLLFLDRIPASAAVNESVSLIRDVAEPRRRDWSGFVNAVLRTFTREPVPSWPDLADDEIMAYTVRYACPRWLVERWIRHFGQDRARDLCGATLEIPPLTVRANTLRVSREALQQALTEAGYDATFTRISPEGLTLQKCGSVLNVPFFREGAFYVEDEAAQLVPLIVDPQPGERVLDACAAPGGKTTHLAALMHNRGEIVALDRSASRLRFIEENCCRLGVNIVSAFQADVSEGLAALPRPFDRILLDAPCSGLGVLRRHPEGKWQKSEDRLARHHREQITLLDRVSHALRPGGVLVYSTCSTESEENEQVIQAFCRARPEFTRESVVAWVPPSGRHLVTPDGDLSTFLSSQSMDGFFAARLRRAVAP